MGGYFFKSREQLFSEIESKFQLKVSNDDDFETDALHSETLSTQGRFSTRTVQASSPVRCVSACLTAGLGQANCREWERSLAARERGVGGCRGKPRAARGSAGQQFPQHGGGRSGLCNCPCLPQPPARGSCFSQLLPRGGHFCTGRIPPVPLPSPTKLAPRSFSQAES